MTTLGIAERMFYNIPVELSPCTSSYIGENRFPLKKDNQIQSSYFIAKIGLHIISTTLLSKMFFLYELSLATSACAYGYNYLLNNEKNSAIAGLHFKASIIAISHCVALFILRNLDLIRMIALGCLCFTDTITQRNDAELFNNAYKDYFQQVYNLVKISSPL